MLNQKDSIITLLQFARKANRLINGFDACADGIRSGEVKLLVVTNDLSVGTREKLDRIHASSANVMLMERYDKEYLGAMLNLKPVGVIGITDKGFADKIQTYLEAESKVEEN